MSQRKPPVLADKFLLWFCKPELLEEVQGDLYANFERTYEQDGRRKSQWKYWIQVFQFIRPFAVKRSKNLNQIDMYKNYLKVVWRNMFKHKVFSVINISSLSVGIAACLIIFLFIKDELSFDSFHTKKDNVYRLCELQTWDGTIPQKVPITWPKMGFQLPDYFPEVKTYARYHSWGELLWQVGDTKLLVKNSAAVDSTFLDVFDFELVAGTKEEALTEPYSVLITEQVAINFFGSKDVIGKTLERDGHTYDIKGILKDIPENSHLQFDILISLSTVRADQPNFNERTGSNYMNTYILMHDNVDIPAMEEKFPAYLSSLVDDEDINDNYQLFLQRLDEVHLASVDIQHDYQNHRKFNGTYIDVFVLTGIFILIIACVNFMNLTAARANTRSKEVGVRKAIGAKRRQLVYQFILESILMSVIALMFALVVDFVLLTYLNDLISRELTMLTIFTDNRLVLVIAAATVLLGLITGLYPSLYLSSFKVVKVLKGVDTGGKKSFFRSSLVVTQFSLALAMIVCTFVVVQQLFFIQDKDIGFDKAHILLVKLNGKTNKSYRVMKEKLGGKSSILGVTASGQRLGNNLHQWGIKIKKDTAMVHIAPSNVLVDYNYLDVYDIKLKSGRTFSEKYAKDDGLAFVINESFVEEFGLGEDAVGQQMGHNWYPNDSLGTIIGVAENFNFNSLHHKVNTLSMVIHSKWNFSEMSIKLDADNIQAGINEVEAVWNEHVIDYPFEYEFLDDHFNEVYKSDQQMGYVITIMAVLSILIGCMGLFGLAAISIERRIKEIGIRKVLGASTFEILVLLSKNFAFLIAISFLIASPLTYLYLDSWLDNFAFRIDINPLIFLLGGATAFVIAMMTISFHTIRASNANPVSSLRYE